jgi:hypothetical protein
MNKLINEKKSTLSSHFNSYPNAMKPNPNDTDSINAMNQHVIDKLQKQLLQKQKLRDELVDVFETDRKNTQAASKLQGAVRRIEAIKQNKELKQIRQDKIKKGREVVEGMKQEQYNKYLQDEAASNFGALSKGALKQRKKALQEQLKQVQGHQLLKDIKQIIQQ